MTRSTTANLNSGITLADHGKLSEAQQYLETTLQLAPDLYEAHLKLGEVLIAEGKSDLAEPHLRKAAQSPNPQVRNAGVNCSANDR